MKRFFGIALLFLLASCSLPLAAARNSQGFVLAVDVQVGDLQIPQGRYNVTWTEPSGSQVQLTLKTEGKKPIVIPARLIAEKHTEAGVTTLSENGVTYLQDFHTTQETFILPGTQSAPK
jgi:phenolic acid decarboxylase